MWTARWLTFAWTRRDFTVQYRQSALGLAWAVAQPLLLLAFYGVVFRQVLHVQQHGNYLVFALCGLAPWTFVSSTASRAVTALSSSVGIIKQVYFPRSIVALATTGVSTIDLLVSTFMLLAVQVVAVGRLHASTLALVPIYIGLTFMVAGAAVVLAILGGFVRDVRFTLPLAIQLGFIATPVMYPAGLVPKQLRWVVTLNPVAHVVASIRTAVIDGTWPSAVSLVAVVGTGVVVLAAALVYSATVEERLPDLL